MPKISEERLPEGYPTIFYGLSLNARLKLLFLGSGYTPIFSHTDVSQSAGSV